MSRHRALFVGAVTPVLAAAMRGWREAGHEIAEVWLPERRHGGSGNRDRRLGLVAPHWSVAATARREGARLRHVPRLSGWDGAADAARATGADALVSVYFPFVVPEAVLDVFGGRSGNLHPAPLPRYRGPTPIAAMLLDDVLERDSAMTLHVIAPGLDEGPIIAQVPVAYAVDMHPTDYTLAMARAGGRMIRDDFPRYLDGGITAAPQDEAAATYMRVSGADTVLSKDLSAAQVERRCRLLAANRPMRVAGTGAKVTGFGKVLGPPTGAPPRIGPVTLEMDVADARVRLMRKLPLQSNWRRLRSLWLNMRAPA